MPTVTENVCNRESILFQLQEQLNHTFRQYNVASRAYLSTQSSNIESIYSPFSASKNLSNGYSTENPNHKIYDEIKNITERILTKSEPEKLTIDCSKSTPDSKELNVPEWLSYIRNNLYIINKHDQLAERISILANDADMNEGVLIDLDSLATFIMFLSSNKIDKRPSVGLNRNGFIDALWRESKDMLVEIVFFPSHESQIVTFSPDLVNPKVINKRVATLPIRNIMSVISSRNLDSLFFSSGNTKGNNSHEFSQNTEKLHAI